jgi:hypothetical protein
MQQCLHGSGQTLVAKNGWIDAVCHVAQLVDRKSESVLCLVESRSDGRIGIGADPGAGEPQS